MQWFRFYSEALNDSKVQALPPHVFKIWVNSLCLASSIDSKDGCIGTIADVSFAFRETESAVSSAFHTLIDKGMIVTVGETFHISKWAKRQFKSDTSTERVRKHRKRSRNVTVTPPDTEQIQNRTDTEQIEEKETVKEKVAIAPPSTKGSRLPIDWELPTEWGEWAEQYLTRDEIILESDKFKDYWIAQTGKSAVKGDWQATWRNWIRRKLESKK